MAVSSPARLAVLAALAAVAAVWACAPAPEAEAGAEGGEGLALTLENIHREGGGVGSAAVAPGGGEAALVAEGPEGRGIYRLELAGEAGPAFWLEGGSPAWSPSGDRLVFVRGGSLWSAPAAGGGEPVRLTGEMEGLRDPVVSPDGATVAFYATESGHQDVWLVAADGTGEPRQLTAEAMAADDSRFAPAWSPDGERIAYVSNRADYWSDDVWVVEVGTGRTRRLSESLMASSRPVWSPSGDRIALFGTAKSGYWYQDLADVWLLDPETGAESVVEMQVWASDHAMRNRPFWSGDGERIYFPYMERGDYDLWSVPSSGGVATRVTNLGGSMRSFDASSGAEVLTFVRSAPEHGRELYRVRATGGPAERVTWMSPAWAGLQEPEEVAYRSWDGLYVQGFLYRPPEVAEGGSCPSLVQVHGGGTNAYLRGQNLTEQWLASQGFVVLAINYRGGSGFGRSFQDLAVEDWLNGQAKDPAPAADWLRAKPYTTDRVGIYGGSYGGMQSMAAITRTPDAFDAAVPMRGVYSEARTFEDQDRLGKIFTKTGHGGLPEERPETYRKSNTLLRLERLEAPVLLMHGEADRRVPFRIHELTVRRLEELGKEFEAHSYPGEGHGFRDPANRIDMYTRLRDFLREHLGACR